MSMPYAFRRRAFMRGLGSAGATGGLGWWLHRAESWAGGAGTPKRLVVLHRPNGTIRDQWLGDGGTPGPILEPFADLADHMRVLDGLRLATFNGGEASHEGGLVTLMTGSPIGTARAPSPDDWRNTEPSLDQILAAQSPEFAGVPFASLQLGAHNRQDGAPEVANRVLSYTGADTPIYPEVTPSLSFQRLFGSIVPGADAEALARIKAKNDSMLSFVDADLARLKQLAPATEHAKLDAHADAIRDLEQSLGGLTGCDPGAVPGDPPDTDNFNDVAAVGAAQLAILRTALQCDVSRVATFMWTPGASGVQFEGLYEGMPLLQHHSLSHENLSATDVARSMTAIDRWYSERTAEFLRSLRDTPELDGNGSLLDNTLVLYITEVAAGTHVFEPMPLVLFGGAGVGLQAGGVASFDGRSTNDLWLTIARQFGVELGSIGAEGQSSGTLDGLFV
ncbi:MAG: DUF1552 domain-containing protein [Deltaproteobacteria bacterium]|nr:DUF1552 domain-containing protein [Nannocystaceae bacterium]